VSMLPRPHPGSLPPIRALEIILASAVLVRIPLSLRADPSVGLGLKQTRR